MVSILNSRTAEKQILYTWELQNLEGLAATLFSLVLPGSPKCKYSFGKTRATLQTGTCPVQLDPLICFGEMCFPLKMAGDWKLEGWGCTHRCASGLPNALKFISLFSSFPSCKRGNTFPLLEGFETSQWKAE